MTEKSNKLTILHRHMDVDLMLTIQAVIERNACLQLCDNVLLLIRSLTLHMSIEIESWEQYVQ